MAEGTLYRKYRPQDFGEVIGQDHVVKVLEGAIKRGNIAHAYLFAGSRGTGKTSVARILSREIGVTDKDLYEIDAASNRGIDDIRELRDGVAVLPFESPYKAYIVDEVHMLTKEAFNALLKTLEEPPKHVVFILATTEIDKLPETIVSRCETHIFKKPSQEVLKKMVLSVAKKEGVMLEPASADLIAELAEGSFRDAHGILQKILSSTDDKKISVEEVEGVTGAPKAKLVNDLLCAIDQGDIKEALKATKNVTQANVEMRVFLSLVMRKIRAVLLLKYAPDLQDEIKGEYTEEDYKILKGLSEKKESKLNSNVLREFLLAYDETARAAISELPLELALVKLLEERS